MIKKINKINKIVLLYGVVGLTSFSCLTFAAIAVAGYCPLPSTVTYNNGTFSASGGWTGPGNMGPQGKIAFTGAQAGVIQNSPNANKLVCWYVNGLLSFHMKNSGIQQIMNPSGSGQWKMISPPLFQCFSSKISDCPFVVSTTTK